MKSRASKLLAALALPALLTTLNSHLSPARAQGTTFTYQGQLQSNGGPANGNYDLQFTLFATNNGGQAVSGPVTNSATGVTNGLFTTAIDFGSGVFTGSNYWLDIAVRTNGGSAFTELSPRQSLTPTPYAIYSANAAVAGTANGVAAGSITAGDIAAGQVVKSLNGYSDAVTFAPGANIGVAASGNSLLISAQGLWTVNGNSGTSPQNGNFIGTTDFQPLELKAGGMRVLRLEPDGRTNVSGVSGNLIGGYTNNQVQQPGSGADFIGSGGFPGGPNIVLSNSAGVFIGAGSANQIGPNVNDSFIGAGFGNSIGVLAYRSVIAGGVDNTNNSGSSLIGSGQNNTIQSGGSYSVIAGGYFNTIQSNTYYATIGGGDGNTIQPSTYNTTIGGGIQQTIGSPYATIGGGGFNTIGTNSNSGTISGGYDNSIESNTFDSAIGGGSFNSIGTNSYYSTIAGGRQNRIADNATASAIGGGFENSAYAPYATVPGGYLNFASGSDSLAAGTEAEAFHSGSFVWADESDFLGFASTANNQFSVRALGGVRFVTGGAGISVDGLIVTPMETVNDANHSNIVNVVGGSSANTVSSGVYGATISGGGAVNYDGTDAPNTVTADFGTVSGGLFNQSSGRQATIGGGSNNVASGQAATVGGGANNSAGGNYSSVPGGYQNSATGNYSLAAGNEAEATNDGAFVWADSQNVPFSSTGTNQFLIRASGGMGINTNAPGNAALNVSGTVRATAFQGDGSGLFNVSGGLANYIFGFNSAIQSVITANTFQDVNFSTDAQLNGWMHAAGTSQYTNAQTGLYLIQYFGQIQSAALNGTNAQMHAALNGTEIAGSRSVVTFAPLQIVTLTKSIIASANASDVLTVQFTGSGTGVRLTGSGNATLTVTRIQ